MVASITDDIYTLHNVDISLQCTIVSDPVSAVQWSYDNQSIMSDETKYKITAANGTAELVVYNISTNDSGEYSCSGTNPLGLVTQIVSVFVQGNAFGVLSMHRAGATSCQLLTCSINYT